MNMITIYYKRGWIVLLSIFLLGSFSCTKKFDELNTRSDQISIKNLDASLLGQAFAQSQYYGWYTDYQSNQNLYADLYAQYYGTNVTYFNSDQNNEQSSWTNSIWRGFYGTAAPQLNFVEQFTKEHAMVLENAIAKVWKVQIYARRTDYWGPIIYSQFGNQEIQVDYDSQEFIYKDFFKTLDSAVAVLKQNLGGTAFPSSDLLYNGKVDKWLTYANSLRLRLALRIAYVEPALAKQEAEKAVFDGVIEDNSDNANLLTTELSKNLMGVIVNFGEFRMSTAMQSVLTGYNDPRIGEYFNEAINGGGYVGIRNGLPSVEKTAPREDYSEIDTKWFIEGKGGTNPPYKVMCAAEVYFLRAEGALRGWNMGGTANELYDKGISTSILEWTSASASQIEEYITSMNVPVAVNDKWNTPAMSDIPVRYQPTASFEKQLEQIITQKWIALFPDGWEAWAERRRTGYPVGYPIIESLNPDVPANAIMRRLKFVTSEVTTNAKAVDEARELLNGPDNNATKLWWDAR